MASFFQVFLMLRTIAAWCLFIAALLFIALFYSGKPPLIPYVNNSTAFYSKAGTLMRISLSDDQQYRLWTPLESIPKDLQTATLLYEDKYFFSHSGVNLTALLRATYSSYLSSGRRMGASTITMQLARMIFELKTNSIPGKLEQIRQAFILERHYSKNELLEAYLNFVPYGHNIQGAAAASVIYFHKPVSHLTRAESLLLAVIPQNPNKRAPTNEQRYTVASHARTRLIDIWAGEYHLSPRIRNSLAAPLKVYSLADLPFDAPHFIDAIQKTKTPEGLRLTGKITTTLSLNLQRDVEQRARRYIDNSRSAGLQNTSIMILDHRTMEIAAELGSVDYRNKSIHGQVNGTRALRSPGSTLKPFIYALGLQQGLIHPATLLNDAPKRFGAYTPENYEQNFSGPLSATDALVLSRNIPAVTLLSQLKQPSFHEWLELTKPARLFSQDHYGLSLALGGNEVSMLELVQWYAALANHGKYQKARSVSFKHTQEGFQQILSAEASFLTLDMLAHNPTVDKQHRISSLQQSSTNKSIPWKTGTSYAFRDAWAIGLVGHYVVAVWVGNFDGRPNPALVGRKAAGPLFFELARMLQHLEPDMNDTWADPGLLNIRKVDLCEITGDLELEHCPNVVSDWFIPGVSPIKSLRIFREIWIDSATGLRACGADAENAQTQVFEFWPSDIELLFVEAGIKTKKAPPFLPECDKHLANTEEDAPEITSPMLSLDYALQSNRLTETQIPFSALTSSDTAMLYWFVGNEFVGKVKADEPFMWKPKLGRFNVTVMDDHGRSANMRLKTTLIN